MTRVLIASAAYGGENVGDDAILAAIVEQLRAVESGVEITAVTRDPDSMGKRLGISAIEFRGLRNRLATYRAIAGSDVLIVGGGALIAEYTHGFKGLVTGHPGYPMTMLLMAKLMGKAAMVYGVGVEDVTFPPARFCIRHIYNRADIITVRDEDSRIRLVEQFGVNVPPVITTADPVLSMSVPNETEIRAILEEKQITVEGDPFVVINFAYGVDRRDRLLEFVAQMADHVISAFGVRVLFVPMNVTTGADRLGMEKVLGRMTHCDRATILDPPYAHREVIGIVSRAELVISSRMHLLILAALSCTPILGISRAPKIDALLARYDMSAGANTQNLDFDQFREVLNRTWRQRQVLGSKISQVRESLRVAALANADHFRNLANQRT